MAQGSDRWIGIDLGTFNSSAAILSRKGKVEIIKNHGGKTAGLFFGKQEKFKEFPSFISFHEDGTVDEVGAGGKAKAESDPERIVWGVKRLVGKTYTELKSSGELDRFPFRIRPDRTNGQCAIAIGERIYTPVDLCAEIFKKIKKDAETQLGEDINSTVVSVPAYFDPLRVTPIVEAARLAGFVHVRTIPEPLAAALAYHIDVSARPVNTLVFDLGAGTLDITVGCLYRKLGNRNECDFQVMKNTGNARLGGIDIDDRILRLIQDKFDLRDIGRGDTAALRRAAELMKIRLSDEPEAKHEFTLDGEAYRCRITQSDLRQAMEGTGAEANLLEECRRQLMAAILESGWEPRDIELALPIGGPTRLPCILDVLRVVFHENSAILEQLDGFSSGTEKVDRMTAVSVGAAMSAELCVDDKVPYGYGIEDMKFTPGEVTRAPAILVPRDSPYPFRSAKYELSWTNRTGLFTVSILQQTPSSEMKQSDGEYQFMGVLKFAVRNPNQCRILVEMGYTENKELKATIWNAFSNESASYIGVSQYACIGMKYPLTIKRPPDIDQVSFLRKTPSEEVMGQFLEWAVSAADFVRRKTESFFLPHMLLTQMIEETYYLLNRNDPASSYEAIFTKLNSLIWNAHSKGVLTRNENNDLVNRLTGFEKELFQ